MKKHSCTMRALAALMLSAAPFSLMAAPGDDATPAAPAATQAAPAVESPAPAPAVAVPMADVKPAPVEVAAPSAPTIQNAAGDNITIAVDSVPVNQVVQMFARAAKANIVAPSLPATNVTVHLENVPWEAALTKILASVDLALVKDEENAGIYSVVTKDQMAIEEIESQIIFLNYTTASNILPVVERMVGGSTNSSVAGFNGANAIVIRGPKSQVKQVKDVIALIDKPRDQVMIECKFVELNDQAIKDLGINWQSLQGWTIGLQTPQAALTRTSVKRNSVDKNYQSRYLEQDATVKITDTMNSTFNETLNTAESSADTSSSFSGSPVPTTSDSSSSSASAGSSSASSKESGKASQTVTFGGNNYTDWDSQQKKAGLVPRRDQTTGNLDFHGSEAINALSAVLSADAFQATLSALQQNEGVEVVSNPKIIVASGETATIHVGRQEPNIVAKAQGDLGDRFAYELDAQKPFFELGVKLNVTPVLNTSNNISLKVSPELSRKLADKVVGEAGTAFPILETRKINTEFSVESGHTVALGGLTQQSETEVVKKIPVLGDIPIIGTYLFRHTHKEKLQDEVIIFVTASSAQASSLQQVSGIPDDAKLIHRHLAKQVEEASKAEELAAKKAPKKAALPK